MNKCELNKILKYKDKNQIIYVNHYHLFSSSFRKFQESFELSQVKKVFIQDGNFGPFRKNVSPIFDWAPHSFGIIFKLFKSKLISFHYSKKLIERNNDIEITVLKFLFIFSNGQKAFVKIGNGFKERKNKISISLINNKNIIFDNNIFYQNQKLINKNAPKPMENLLQEFYNSIISKTFNNTSFDIAKNTSNFIFNNLIKY